MHIDQKVELPYIFAIEPPSKSFTSPIPNKIKIIVNQSYNNILVHLLTKVCTRDQLRESPKNVFNQVIELENEAKCLLKRVPGITALEN